MSRDVSLTAGSAGSTAHRWPACGSGVVIGRGFEGRPTALDHLIKCSSRIPLLRLRERSATAPPPTSQCVVVRDDDFSTRWAIGNEIQLSIASHDDLFPSWVPDHRRIGRWHNKAISLAVRRVLLISSNWEGVDVLPPSVIAPSEHPEPCSIDGRFLDRGGKAPQSLDGAHDLVPTITMKPPGHN